MQIDMHYYATWAMARAAGLTHEACRVIATAAEYVDDNAGGDTIVFRDGGHITTDATAHHTVDKDNLDLSDQRNVWVPFHFMPGNEGADYTCRLRCVTDSAVAREMVDENRRAAVEAVNEAHGRGYALALMGITAHVYADTFSHYGFSGVSSRGNRIQDGSLTLKARGRGGQSAIRSLEARAARFEERYGLGIVFDNIKAHVNAQIERFAREKQSRLAQDLSGGLGHGAALTYPDQPFLIWHFVYEQDGEPSGERNNPRTFEDGCKALHAWFGTFAPESGLAEAGVARRWSKLKGPVARIVGTNLDDKLQRAKLWQDAARDGTFSSKGAETIPPYDAEAWHEERRRMNGTSHSSAFLDTEVYHFYRAAAYHRTYVLRDLLPRHGLVVD